MSIRVFAASDPDPYQACHWGVTDHPHYYDCQNCEYAKYDACDIGRINMQAIAHKNQKDECDRIIAEIDAFCKTTYY